MFVGVHDSFWTHACDVDQMNEILREKFIELYSMPILENVSRNFPLSSPSWIKLVVYFHWLHDNSACSQLLESFQASYPALTFPPLPERGEFDLQEVLESPYFFNWNSLREQQAVITMFEKHCHTYQMPLLEWPRSCSKSSFVYAFKREVGNENLRLLLWKTKDKLWFPMISESTRFSWASIICSVKDLVHFTHVQKARLFYRNSRLYSLM